MTKEWLLLALCYTYSVSASFIGYVPIDHVKPGQLRFTQFSVDSKKNNLIPVKQKFDKGKSSISENNPFAVLKGPEDIGYILIDGHHGYLASKALGDSTVPISVIEDLSYMVKDRFYSYALEKNYIYPVTRMGDLLLIPEQGWFSWDILQDDPNRFFVAITALKCTRSQNSVICYKDGSASEKPHYPLWIKKSWKKVECAFIELKVATQLYKLGINYSYEMGTNPNSSQLAEFIEQARRALQANSVANLELISERQKFEDLAVMLNQ